MNSGVVSWASRELLSVALSSTEIEYMALTQGVKESLWLGELQSDIRATQHREEIRQIQCNNQEAIALTRNPEYHARMKYIDIQYHFIRQNVESGTIQLTYYPMIEMTADIFTKPLSCPQFEKHFCGPGLAKSPTFTSQVSEAEST